MRYTALISLSLSLLSFVCVCVCSARSCLQESDELPADFTKMFDDTLFTFDTSLVPEVVNVYKASVTPIVLLLHLSQKSCERVLFLFPFCSLIGF